MIQLGAKYAPCMRKDKELSRLLEKERREEAETGCCIGTDQNGCIQKSQERCKVNTVDVLRVKTETSLIDRGRNRTRDV